MDAVHNENSPIYSLLRYLSIIGLMAGTAGLTYCAYVFSCTPDWHQIFGMLAFLIVISGSFWLYAWSENKRKEIEEENRRAFEEAVNRQRMNYIVPDERDKKTTWVVPVLADIGPGIPIHMGMLFTEKAKVKGEEVDFLELVMGDPEPGLNAITLPQNMGGITGITAGLSHRWGMLRTGMAFQPNSKVLGKDDINVMVVLLYNTSTRESGKAKGHVCITNEVDPARLNPLTERLLKCDFIALDALKKKVNDPLTNMILDELPEFIEKHFKP